MRYVGLPLLVEFARSGLHATAIDLDARKVAAIKGESYIPDVPFERMTSSSFSPEHVNPGNGMFNTRNVPRISAH